MSRCYSSVKFSASCGLPPTPRGKFASNSKLFGWLPSLVMWARALARRTALYSRVLVLLEDGKIGSWHTGWEKSGLFPTRLLTGCFWIFPHSAEACSGRSAVFEGPLLGSVFMMLYSKKPLANYTAKPLGLSSRCFSFSSSFFPCLWTSFLGAFMVNVSIFLSSNLWSFLQPLRSVSVSCASDHC